MKDGKHKIGNQVKVGQTPPEQINKEIVKTNETWNSK